MRGLLTYNEILANPFLLKYIMIAIRELTEGNGAHRGLYIILAS